MSSLIFKMHVKIYRSGKLNYIFFKIKRLIDIRNTIIIKKKHKIYRFPSKCKIKFLI